MRRRGAPCLLTFDLLRVGGRDVCDEPIEHRKTRLADLISGRTSRLIQYTGGLVGEGSALFDVIQARGMEGIVAKRLGSAYVPGRRTGAWVKVKVPGYAPDRRERFNGGGRRQEELA
jgi:bifunctional non-homologous end joining protein LigD